MNAIIQIPVHIITEEEHQWALLKVMNPCCLSCALKANDILLEYEAFYN